MLTCLFIYLIIFIIISVFALKSAFWLIFVSIFLCCLPCCPNFPHSFTVCLFTIFCPFCCCLYTLPVLSWFPSWRPIFISFFCCVLVSFLQSISNLIVYPNVVYLAWWCFCIVICLVSGVMLIWFGSSCSSAIHWFSSGYPVTDLFG